MHAPIDLDHRASARGMADYEGLKSEPNGRPGRVGRGRAGRIIYSSVLHCREAKCDIQTGGRKIANVYNGQLKAVIISY